MQDRPQSGAFSLTGLPTRFAFIASSAPDALEAEAALIKRYGQFNPHDAQTIVALGGDGLMLQCLHQQMSLRKPIYAMNRGSVGFLMNEFSLDALPERIARAERAITYPLLMKAIATDGTRREARAINEVSLIRQSYQAAKLRIDIDGKMRLEELIADGILLATPTGSTAYNFSANGPILPLAAPLLALTPISPFRPRRWRGALLPDRATVRITILEPEKRPVAAAADHIDVPGIASVEIALDRSIDLVMLHDPGHSLDERILREQFWG
jgi:NAD+ kinase